ncbi:hypothetical protein [Nonomuraea sp. NPDC049480]|uniref:hypothetical protein n=1 Tax=Nonomuraea sp. NPDC049480 TaxID=3364353 RepID=UPI0037B833AC
MLDQIPGAAQVAYACLAARGGTITKALGSIAWTYTAHQPGPWSDGFYRNTCDSVRDYAAHIYDMLDGYRPNVQFDDVRPEHYNEFIRSVVPASTSPATSGSVRSSWPITCSTGCVRQLRCAWSPGSTSAERTRT